MDLPQMRMNAFASCTTPRMVIKGQTFIGIRAIVGGVENKNPFCVNIRKLLYMIKILNDICMELLTILPGLDLRNFRMFALVVVQFFDMVWGKSKNEQCHVLVCFCVNGAITPLRLKRLTPIMNTSNLPSRLHELYPIEDPPSGLPIDGEEDFFALNAISSRIITKMDQVRVNLRALSFT